MASVRCAPVVQVILQGGITETGHAGAATHYYVARCGKRGRGDAACYRMLRGRPLQQESKPWAGSPL